MSDTLWYSFGHDVVGPVVGGAIVWITARLQGRRHAKSHFTDEELRLDSRRSIQIHERLAVLRDRLGATRAYVARFHNGATFAGDDPFRRESRTHEVVTDGYIPQRDRYDGLLVSLVADEMKLIIDEGHSFTRTRDLAPGTPFWNLCVEGRVGAVARCCLKKKGEIIGAIGVDWDASMEAPPEGIDLLVEFARRIEAILFMP